MEFVSCDPSNYRAGRTQPVRYIVMHYTANNGDTAKNNCDYYHRVGGLQASAHYFCDEHGAMQSVRECDTAWHCGARAYWHPECRNANSIGIEMCSRKRADVATTSCRRPWQTPRRWRGRSCSAMASTPTTCCGTTT